MTEQSSLSHLTSKDSRHSACISPHNFGELVLTPVVTIGDPMLASLVLARVHHDDGEASGPSWSNKALAFGDVVSVSRVV